MTWPVIRAWPLFPEGIPEFSTIMKVLKALGLKLGAAQVAQV